MAGIKYGTEEDWENMWEDYLTETDASEKGKLLNALGQTRDSNLLARWVLVYLITLAVLNKLECHAHLQFFS